MVVTNIGTDTVGAGNINTVTASGSGVLIVVGLFSPNNVTFANGDVTDGVGNTYNIAVQGHPNGVGANGTAAIFYVVNATNLPVSSNISESNAGAGNSFMSAVAVTNVSTVAAIDATGSATGSSTTPSATSSAPTFTDIFIGFVASNTPSGTFNQDAAWTIPPNAALVKLNGGNKTSASAATFAPTYSTTRPWIDLIVGFKHS
jgi:hypothetical protein